MFTVKEASKARVLPKLFSSFFSSRRGLSKEGARSVIFPASVELGTNSIKLMQLAKAPQGCAILKIDYLPLSNSTINIRTTLSELINNNDIKGKVVSSLPLSKIQVFTFFLPNMPEEEIEQAITWKLKQNLPSGYVFEGISFDYSYKAHSGNSLNEEFFVIAFAALKDLAGEYIKLFQEFSLELAALEPVPYAVFSALMWQGKINKDETVLILDLGANESSITIVHAGQPYTMRPLAISGNILTEAIAGFHQIDLKKAEALKIDEGLSFYNSSDSAKNNSMCLPALSSQLESLVVDVEHTFKFFSHQLMKAKISAFDRVFLTGGTSCLKSLDIFLKDKLGAPVEVFNPIASLETVPGYQISPSVKLMPSSFAGTAGMAARFAVW